MDHDPVPLRRSESHSAAMTKVFNRAVVQKYLHHKLSRKGHVWRFDCGDADDGPESDGSPLLYEARGSVHRVLREAGEELERLYQSDFTEMSRRLYLTSATARSRFAEVVDELFRDGVNWGRIIAFFEFGGTVCVECASKEDMTSQVDLIAEWMTDYLNGPRLNSWIVDNGGWDTFVELYDRHRDSVFNCSWPSIKTVFGLAALGAASLTIGAYLAQK
ncbi:apoptosis regulator Bcl-2 [Neosynchiropus ocellatus]